MPYLHSNGTGISERGLPRIGEDGGTQSSLAGVASDPLSRLVDGFARLRRPSREGNLGLYAHAHLSSGGARSPLAVIRLSAISEILRFWFIAVLRKSA